MRPRRWRAAVCHPVSRVAAARPPASQPPCNLILACRTPRICSAAHPAPATRRRRRRRRRRGRECGSRESRRPATLTAWETGRTAWETGRTWTWLTDSFSSCVSFITHTARETGRTWTWLADSFSSAVSFITHTARETGRTWTSLSLRPMSTASMTAGWPRAPTRRMARMACRRTCGSRSLMSATSAAVVAASPCSDISAICFTASRRTPAVLFNTKSIA